MADAALNSPTTAPLGFGLPQAGLPLLGHVFHVAPVMGTRARSSPVAPPQSCPPPTPRASVPSFELAQTAGVEGAALSLFPCIDPYTICDGAPQAMLPCRAALAPSLEAVHIPKATAPPLEALWDCNKNQNSSL